jgi:hypothetical protein
MASTENGAGSFKRVLGITAQELRDRDKSSEPTPR